MKRRLWSIGLCLVVLTGAGVARADSVPIIRGALTGLEFCPQSFCGSAIFAGLFLGQVGFNRRVIGGVAVSVNHEPLPDPGETSAITGGIWQLYSGLRQFGGTVTGTLLNNGDNTFTVQAVMGLNQGGTGEVLFVGLLDHNVLPPTIIGQISQQ